MIISKERCLGIVGTNRSFLVDGLDDKLLVAEGNVADLTPRESDLRRQSTMNENISSVEEQQVKEENRTRMEERKTRRNSTRRRGGEKEEKEEVDQNEE